MASRCRWKEFEGYRKEAHAEPHRREGTTVSMRDLSGRGDVEDPFIQESRTPQWTSIVDNVKFKFQELTAQLRELDGLHKKIMMPSSFGFESAEEEGHGRVSDLTDEISGNFTYCHKWVSLLDKDGVGSNRDKQVRKNVQMALAQKLQEHSSSFRRKQREFMKKLNQQRSAGSDNPFAFSPVFDDDEDFCDDYSLQQMEQINGQVDEMSAMVDERHKEITEIAKSISDLAQIFRELSTLVIDSGTILDRIDYNMEHVQVNVEAAEEDLTKATTYQTAGKGCSAWCIIFLVFACIVMTLVLGLKKGLK